MNSIASSFSAESREMMSLSKDIAIRLGHAHISTLHFFLANCAVDTPYSLKQFAFRDEEAYEAFYESCISPKPVTFTSAAVPLTIEAEKAVRSAVQVWFRRYRDDEIKSYHILLAAAGNASSAFASRLKMGGNLQRKIEHYYVERVVLREHDIKRSFWEKFLKNRFPF